MNMANTNIKVLPRAVSVPATLHKAMPPVPQGDFGSLIFDGCGIVRKCNEAAAQMFGGSPFDMEGSTVWSLLPHVTPSDKLSGDSSPSYRARYIAYLSNVSSWHHLQATDVYGQDFPVEILLSRLKTDGHELFVINVRHSANK